MPQTHLDNDLALFSRSLMSEEVFYNHIRAHVMGVVFITLGRRDPDLADEIAAAVLLALPRFKGLSSFNTWVWSIARHLAFMERRRCHDFLSVLESDKAEDPAWEVQLALEEQLERLRGEEQALLLLHLMGNSDAEIAALTGLTSEAVKSRRRDSRRKIKEGLNEVADIVP